MKQSVYYIESPEKIEAHPDSFNRLKSKKSFQVAMEIQDHFRILLQHSELLGNSQRKTELALNILMRYYFNPELEIEENK